MIWDRNWEWKGSKREPESRDTLGKNLYELRQTDIFDETIKNPFCGVQIHYEDSYIKRYIEMEKQARMGHL